MPRPVKIKKPKSFMFTTRHHSFSGVIGCVLCVISIAVLVVSIYFSFINAGKTSIAVGGMGFMSLVLNFIGIIAGITALSERDIYRWVPTTAIIANIVVLGLWVALVIYGRG